MGALSNILVCGASDLSAAGLSLILYNTGSASVGTDRTFRPNGQIAPGVNEYVDRSASFEAAFPRYTFSVKLPPRGPRAQGQSRNIRIVEKITYPVANVTSPSTGSGIQPQPSVAFNLVCNREYIIPEPALLADRKIFLSLCASFLATDVAASDGTPVDHTGTPVTAAVLTSEQPY